MCNCYERFSYLMLWLQQEQAPNVTSQMVTTKESENIKLSYKKTILKLRLLNYLEIVKIARYKDCFPIKHEENIYCIPITENI